MVRETDVAEKEADFGQQLSDPGGLLGAVAGICHPVTGAGLDVAQVIEIVFAGAPGVDLVSVFAVDGADVAAKEFALVPSGFRSEGIRIDLSGFRIDVKISCFGVFWGKSC